MNYYEYLKILRIGGKTLIPKDFQDRSLGEFIIGGRKKQKKNYPFICLSYHVVVYDSRPN
jgi:hypothetical protein